MTASINLHCTPTPLMWTGAVTPPEADLLADDGSQLLADDGSTLTRD